MRRGLAQTRSQAQELVLERMVLVGGSCAERPARLVAPGEPVEVLATSRRYVGRGGNKLAGALDHFDIDVRGCRALDAGASTGGFTDCLLQRGASWVLALDVGRGQLHARLARDPRVCSRERTDVRDLQWEDLGGCPVDVVVADLSFISLRSVASALVGVAGIGAEIVALVKPQFECGRRAASAGKGVIRDPALWSEAILAAGSSIASAGADMIGAMVSPLLGAEGNVEFFLRGRVRPPGQPGADRCDASELARRIGLEELLTQAAHQAAGGRPAGAGLDPS